MHSGKEKDLSEAQKYLNAIDIAQRQLEETMKSKVYADLEKVYPRDLKVWINFLLLFILVGVVNQRTHCYRISCEIYVFLPASHV